VRRCEHWVEHNPPDGASRIAFIQAWRGRVQLPAPSHRVLDFQGLRISPSTSSIVRRIGCSESYCAGMTLGQPEISIASLNELASVLASFNANRKRSAQSNRSIKPE
jgi:hypothetical protein